MPFSIIWNSYCGLEGAIPRVGWRCVIDKLKKQVARATTITLTTLLARLLFKKKLGMNGPTGLMVGAARGDYI